MVEINFRGETQRLSRMTRWPFSLPRSRPRPWWKGILGKETIHIYKYIEGEERDSRRQWRLRPCLQKPFSCWFFFCPVFRKPGVTGVGNICRPLTTGRNQHNDSPAATEIKTSCKGTLVSFCSSLCRLLLQQLNLTSIWDFLTSLKGAVRRIYEGLLSRVKSPELKSCFIYLKITSTYNTAGSCSCCIVAALNFSLLKLSPLWTIFFTFFVYFSLHNSTFLPAVSYSRSCGYWHRPSVLLLCPQMCGCLREPEIR